MTEIDLHGFKHDEVEDKLPNLLILHYNMGNFPIRLITGKSEKMKEIVREICEKYEFNIDDTWNSNPGTIILMRS
jgi:DNA-nicking Smr family endonuclease|tara:strand:- start:562 stop:786 length:225 start_codon:yes stop_codon:yes gene_type:complete